jgi:hypothetical protein
MLDALDMNMLPGEMQWIKEDGAPKGVIAVSKAGTRLRGCLPELSADRHRVRAEE